jgi:hypothetical protein
METIKKMAADVPSSSAGSHHTQKPISASSLEPITKDELLELKGALEKKHANHDYATL